MPVVDAARSDSSPRGLDPRVLDALVAIVGRGAVVTEPGRLLSYETDALARYTSLPRAVVLPADSEQAAGVVAVLAEAQVPITPRGAGTGLSGGSVASPGGVLLGTSRMNRILSLDPVRRLARVQAGVINTDLSAAARPHGLHYPPDPSSQTACTLGGNVGENAGGPHCLKYGVTTRYVTGLTLVTGSGQVLELGGAHRLEGQDLVGLVVGSEGLLGLVTEVEVRLLPLARYVRTLLGVFDSTHQAGEAVSDIIARGLLPAAMEIMDRATIEAVEASVFAAGYPRGAGAVLVVEFDGAVDTLSEDAGVAAELCRAAGALEVRVARDEAERQALWQGRKKAYGAFGRITPDLMVQDATVPRSVLPTVLEEIEAVGRRYDLRLANVFHAGDGNLHPKILYDRRDPELVERVEAASSEIMKICVAAGGTITGEHGVGLDKRAYMPLVHGPAELALMARVQRAFDPAGRWNPGKVLPDDSTGRVEPGALGAPGDREGAGGARGDGDEWKGVQHTPADLTARVRGDVTLRELQTELAKHRQWLPVDGIGETGSQGGGAATGGTAPAGAGVGDRTLEELVLAGWSGPLAPAMGGIRDHLLGLEVVPHNGEPLRFGGQVMKNVAGFDLVRLMTGSRGGLGRVRGATVRLLPLPALSRTLTWRFPAEAGVAESGVTGEAGGEWLQRLARAVGVVATHPILPASVGVVVDGVGARLILRLCGSRAGVEAETGEMVAAVESSARVGPESGPEVAVEDLFPESGLFVAEDALARVVAEVGGSEAGVYALRPEPGTDPLLRDAGAVRSLARSLGSVVWLPLWGRVVVTGVGEGMPPGVSHLLETVADESGEVAALRERIALAFNGGRD